MRARAKNVTTLKLLARPVSARAPEGALRHKISGHVRGQIVALTDQGVLVKHPHAAAACLAHSVVPIDAALRAQVGEGPVDALLVFEEEHPDRPIVVGLLQPLAPPAVPTPSATPETTSLRAEAVVDGERVVLEGRDEIVLRCGKASITLRRNGRVIIRGTYLESRSEGVHRIQGGSVEIN